MSDIVKKEEPKTLGQWLNSNRERFIASLPQGGVTIDRFLAAASFEIGNSKKLQACDRASLANALVQSARFGLEVGGMLGQAFLIPYNERRQLPSGEWAKVMTCHFQAGYKGLIVLARRSQTIKTICAEVVYENDQFEAILGLHPNLTHKIDIRKPRGEAVAYYAAVELTNGGFQFKVLSKEDAQIHRDRYSKGFQQSPEDNPWETNFEAMALKTCIIKVLKLCPMSVEALEAVNQEERQMEMRNVTGTGLDDIPPPSEDATVEKEEPTKAEPGARVAKAREAAAAAAGKAPKAAPEAKVEPTDGKKPADAATAQDSPREGSQPSPLEAGKAMVEKYMETIPKEEQAKYKDSLKLITTLEALETFYKGLLEKFGEPELF